MQCPRCSCPDFVRVKQTHRMFSLFGRVFSRFSGFLTVCGNCGAEVRVTAAGVAQTLRGPQAMPQPAPNGDDAPPQGMQPRMRDSDQSRKWQRR